MTPSAVRRRNRCAGPAPRSSSRVRAPRRARPRRRSRPRAASRRRGRPQGSGCRRAAAAPPRRQDRRPRQVPSPITASISAGREPRHQHDGQGAARTRALENARSYSEKTLPRNRSGIVSCTMVSIGILRHGYEMPSANESTRIVSALTTGATARHASAADREGHRHDAALREPRLEPPDGEHAGDDARAARGDDAAVGRDALLEPLLEDHDRQDARRSRTAPGRRTPDVMPPSAGGVASSRRAPRHRSRGTCGQPVLRARRPATWTGGRA